MLEEELLVITARRHRSIQDKRCADVKEDSTCSITNGGSVQSIVDGFGVEFLLLRGQATWLGTRSRVFLDGSGEFVMLSERMTEETPAGSVMA